MSWQATRIVACTLVVAGACVLGPLAASSASTPACKSGQTSTRSHPCTSATIAPTPTVSLGAPQPVSDINPDTGVPNPDTADQGQRVCGCDADTILRYLNPMAGTFELYIYNTSAIGYINTINWLPPNGMTVTAITGSSGGSCTLDAGDISCTANGQGIAPPKCTCEHGGVMTVSFTATGDQPTYNGSWWIYHGVVGDYMQITSMTPVPWYIPSFKPGKTNGV